MGAWLPAGAARHGGRGGGSLLGIQAEEVVVTTASNALRNRYRERRRQPFRPTGIAENIEAQGDPSRLDRSHKI
jgi:hypothetical protein